MERFGTVSDAAPTNGQTIMSRVSGEKKKQVRCLHFPNCKNTDEECPFVHPKEDCKYFPACTNGEKCIFLHPEVECKFGIQCTRQNCAYKHPKGKGAKVNPMAQMTNVMQMMMMMQQGMKPRPKPRAFVEKQKPAASENK